MHCHHHCAEEIGLSHRLPSLQFLHAFGATQNFESVGKIYQFLALSWIYHANPFEGDIERTCNFLDLGAVSEENRSSKAKRMKLTRRLEHARFRAFRKDNSLRMPLQFFVN